MSSLAARLEVVADAAGFVPAHVAAWQPMNAEDLALAKITGSSEPLRTHLQGRPSDIAQQFSAATSVLVPVNPLELATALVGQRLQKLGQSVVGSPDEAVMVHALDLRQAAQLADLAVGAEVHAEIFDAQRQQKAIYRGDAAGLQALLIEAMQRSPQGNPQALLLMAHQAGLLLEQYEQLAADQNALDAAATAQLVAETEKLLQARQQIATMVAQAQLATAQDMTATTGLIGLLNNLSGQLVALQAALNSYRGQLAAKQPEAALQAASLGLRQQIGAVGKTVGQSAEVMGQMMGRLQAQLAQNPTNTALLSQLRQLQDLSAKLREPAQALGKVAGQPAVGVVRPTNAATASNTATGRLSFATMAAFVLNNLAPLRANPNAAAPAVAAPAATLAGIFAAPRAALSAAAPSGISNPAQATATAAGQLAAGLRGAALGASLAVLSPLTNVAPAVAATAPAVNAALLNRATSPTLSVNQMGAPQVAVPNLAANPVLAAANPALAGLQAANTASPTGNISPNMVMASVAAPSVTTSVVTPNLATPAANNPNILTAMMVAANDGPQLGQVASPAVVSLVTPTLSGGNEPSLPHSIAAVAPAAVANEGRASSSPTAGPTSVVANNPPANPPVTDAPIVTATTTATEPKPIILPTAEGTPTVVPLAVEAKVEGVKLPVVEEKRAETPPITPVSAEPAQDPAKPTAIVTGAPPVVEAEKNNPPPITPHNPVVDALPPPPPPEAKQTGETPTSVVTDNPTQNPPPPTPTTGEAPPVPSNPTGGPTNNEPTNPPVKTIQEQFQDACKGCDGKKGCCGTGPQTAAQALAQRSDLQATTSNDTQENSAEGKSKDFRTAAQGTCAKHGNGPCSCGEAAKVVENRPINTQKGFARRGATVQLNNAA